MRPAEREQWILNWMRQRPSESVDVLNAEFVSEFIDATGCKSTVPLFGAEKCPQLGRDLGRLHSKGLLRRMPVGLQPGDASMGFPKWVWSYRL